MASDSVHCSGSCPTQITVLVRSGSERSPDLKCLRNGVFLSATEPFRKLRQERICFDASTTIRKSQIGAKESGELQTRNIHGANTVRVNRPPPENFRLQESILVFTHNR